MPKTDIFPFEQPKLTQPKEGHDRELDIDTLTYPNKLVYVVLNKEKETMMHIEDYRAKSEDERKKLRKKYG